MAAHQAPLSPGFSRQEHWSGLPFPSPMHESEKWKWSCSVVSDSETPWTTAYQAPLSMGFSRQEYWSGSPLPSPWSHIVPGNSPGQNTGVGGLSLSRGSSQPRNRTGISCIACGFFTNWAIRETWEIKQLQQLLKTNKHAGISTHTWLKRLLEIENGSTALTSDFPTINCR